MVLASVTDSAQLSRTARTLALLRTTGIPSVTVWEVALSERKKALFHFTLMRTAFLERQIFQGLVDL